MCRWRRPASSGPSRQPPSGSQTPFRCAGADSGAVAYALPVAASASQRSRPVVLLPGSEPARVRGARRIRRRDAAAGGRATSARRRVLPRDRRRVPLLRRRAPRPAAYAGAARAGSRHRRARTGDPACEPAAPVAGRRGVLGLRAHRRRRRGQPLQRPSAPLPRTTPPTPPSRAHGGRRPRRTGLSSRRHPRAERSSSAPHRRPRAASSRPRRRWGSSRWRCSWRSCRRARPSPPRPSAGTRCSRCTSGVEVTTTSG